MAYILGIVVVAFFFLALHYFTELSKSQKIIITAILLAIISAAIAFNAYGTAQREKILDVALRFNQNKTLKCNGIDVNNSNYTLSDGTYTFIGKENTPNYAQMISASQCE